MDGKAAITGVVGVNYFFPNAKDFPSYDLTTGKITTNTLKYNIVEFDIKGGFKYYITDFFYAMGEIGFGYYLTSVTTEDAALKALAESGFKSKAGFIYAPAIGYVLPIGESYLDFSIRYQGTTASWGEGSNAATPNVFAVKIAYNLL